MQKLIDIPPISDQVISQDTPSSCRHPKRRLSLSEEQLLTTMQRTVESSASKKRKLTPPPSLTHPLSTVHQLGTSLLIPVEGCKGFYVQRELHQFQADQLVSLCIYSEGQLVKEEFFAIYLTVLQKRAPVLAETIKSFRGRTSHQIELKTLPEFSQNYAVVVNTLKYCMQGQVPIDPDHATAYLWLGDYWGIEGWIEACIDQLTIDGDNLEEVCALTRQINSLPLINKLVQYAVDHMCPRQYDEYQNYLMNASTLPYLDIVKEFGAQCQTLSLDYSREEVAPEILTCCPHVRTLTVETGNLKEIYQGGEEFEGTSLNVLQLYLNRENNRLRDLIFKNDLYVFYELQMLDPLLESPHLHLDTLCVQIDITEDRHHGFASTQDHINAILTLLSKWKDKVPKLGIALELHALDAEHLRLLKELHLTRIEHRDTVDFDEYDDTQRYADTIQELCCWEELEEVSFSTVDFSEWFTYEELTPLWANLATLSARKLSIRYQQNANFVALLEAWMLNPDHLRNLEELTISHCNSPSVRVGLEAALTHRPQLKYKLLTGAAN